MEKYILLGVGFLIFWELHRRLNKIEGSLFSIELRLRDKVDKPTEFEKYMEERKKKPKLTRKELDKEMTPEEKAYWMEKNGTGYPDGVE